MERVEYAAVDGIEDGIEERWLDADQDGRFERREFVRLSDGEVVDAFEDRGRAGYVRVK